MTSPLKAKRIVITRAAHQYAEFADKLTRFAAVPLAFPVIETQPINGHVVQHYCERITSFDWVLFTSVNAVHTFFALAQPDQLTHPKIGVIGQATRKALQHYGLTADLMPETASGQALADALGDVTGQYIMLPRSKKGLPDIVSTLKSAGADVYDVPIYDTIPAMPSAAHIAALQAGVDFVTFTSPSCVENFFALVDQDQALAQVLWYDQTVRHIAIGNTTAAAYETLFGDLPLIADVASLNGLIDAMVRNAAPINSNE